MAYLLCGYHMVKDTGPHCLLYDKQKNTFKTKRLKNEKCFRCAFDTHPPFKGSIVDENDNGIKLVAYKPCAIEDLSFMTLSEQAIDHIFKRVMTIKSSIKNNIPFWSYMTEKEFVLNSAFKKDFVRNIRVGLIDILKLEKNPRENYYLPCNLQSLFIRFEPVNYCHHEAEEIVIRHKLIKYVLEDTCPFIKVALFESLGLEMALAMSLPTGSTGKGVEIFCPKKITDNNNECLLEASDNLAFDGFNFSIVTDKTRYTKVVKPEFVPLEYFDWIELSEQTSYHQKKPSKYFYDIKKQLALLGSVQTDFFSKGAVVFAAHGKTDKVACFDFSNFYANVVIKFGLDFYVIEVLKKLIEFRSRFDSIKSWIVVLLGKSKHLDLYFYNRMKALSVAVILSTINKNSESVTGAVTDGLFVASSSSFLYPDGFPVKQEFVPSVMISAGATRYAGICAKTGNIVHRGFIGRKSSKYPKWYSKIIGLLLKECLGDGHTSDALIRQIQEILQREGSETKDYVLPDTHREALPIQDKHPAVEYYVNNLCTGLCQVYAVVDDYVLPPGIVNNGQQLLTQTAFSVKLINVSHYVELFEKIIKRVAEIFLDQPNLVSLCERVFWVVKEHVTKTLPIERAVYPGATDNDD